MAHRHAGNDHTRATGITGRLGVLGALAIALTTLGCAGGGGGGPGSPERMSIAEYDLARDAFEHQRFREALEHVDKALEHDDEHADAAYLGAVLLMGFCALDASSPDCRFDDAERYTRTALEADPEMRDAKNALGVILTHQGRYQEAITVLEPLSKDIIYGSPEKAWGNLGWAYLEAGRADEAIAALKRSVAAQPNFCVGHYRLGLAYEKKGEHAAARQSLTRAVSTEHPECERFQDAFAARARVLKHLGQVDPARADLQRCRDLGPKSPAGKACATELQALP